MTPAAVCDGMTSPACGAELCKMLDNLGVPATPQWRGLILYIYSQMDAAPQAADEAGAVLKQVLDAGVFSEDDFIRLQRYQEDMFSRPLQDELRSMLGETAVVLAEFGVAADASVDKVRGLEREALSILRNEPNLARAINRIRTSFETTIKNLEEDNRRLKELTMTDPLTGLANRRAMDDFISRHLHVCTKASRPFAVILADIDHFKRFNDSYGHLVGDQAMRSVAKLMKSLQDKLHHNVREGVAEPLAARFGGEEFLLALPGFDLDQAMDVAEMLRRRVADYSFVLRDEHGVVIKSDINLSVSLGVAEALETNSYGNPQRLLAKADAALYEAKRNGRNRVRCADCA